MRLLLHDLELKGCQVFAPFPPPKQFPIDYSKLLIELIEGKVPARPQDGERLGLDDKMWKKIKECLDFRPKGRPTMKDVRSFLEPLHQKWIRPTPESTTKSDTAHGRDEDDSYIDFTSHSDSTVPSRPSSTGISFWDTPLESGESPGNAPSLDPALVPTRTKEWILSQRSDSFPKICRPGVTFEESPVIFNIPARSKPDSASASTETQTHLW